MNIQIMSGDIITAEWADNRLNIIDEAHLPLFLKNYSDLNSWLETRAIDSHRANSRLLKKALRLAQRDDVSAVLHVNAATITDNYWIRPLGSRLCYDDIRFNDDYFSSLALRGDYDSFNRSASRKNSRTPELTNIGSFEKCWKLENGTWWLCKAANDNEMFSELFVYKLGELLGMNMAEYKRGDGCIMSRDFTSGATVNFEHASSFMGDNDDYTDTMEKLREICPQAVPDYLRMIFLDTITANPDRHTSNFGLLRDVQSGELLGLAPVFDHNMALISRGYPTVKPENDILIHLFAEVTDGSYIPELTEKILASAIDDINMPVRREEIIEFVMNRYRYIKNRRS